MTFDNILVRLIELFTSDLDVVEMKRQIRAAKIEFSPILSALCYDMLSCLDSVVLRRLWSFSCVCSKKPNQVYQAGFEEHIWLLAYCPLIVKTKRQRNLIVLHPNLFPDLLRFFKQLGAFPSLHLCL